MTEAILRLAERLCASGKTFLSDQTLAGYGRRFSISGEDARRAAIMADRLRRQMQVDEGRPGFSARPVHVDAPIVLKQLDKRERAARKCG